MRHISPDMPDTTNYVTLIDIVYTGYLSNKDLTIDFREFITEDTKATYYIADYESGTNATPSLLRFIRALIRIGFRNPPFMQRTTRGVATQAIVADFISNTRTSTTFIVVTNSKLLRSICSIMKRRYPHIQFVFVEHELTLQHQSDTQLSKYIIFDMKDIFPNAIK